MKTTSWVIENFDQVEVRYWNGLGLDGWTDKHLDAVRFHKADAAAKVRDWLIDQTHASVRVEVTEYINPLNDDSALPIILANQRKGFYNQIDELTTVNKQLREQVANLTRDVTSYKTELKRVYDDREVVRRKLYKIKDIVDDNG